MSRVAKTDESGNLFLKDGNGGVLSLEASNKMRAKFIAQLEKTASKTRFDMTQLMWGAGEGAMAGLNLSDITDITDSTAKLAQAGGKNLDFKSAFDLSTNIAKAFGVDLKNLDKIQNQIAQASNSTNSTIPQIAQAIKFLAPSVVASGGTLEDSFAEVMFLSQRGLKDSIGGTTIARMYEKMSAGLGAKSQAMLDEVGLSLNKWFDGNGNRKSNVEMSKHIQAAYKSNSKMVVNAALDGAFGLRGSRGAKLMGQKDADKEMKKYRKLIIEAGKNFKGDNSALNQMARIQMQGLYGALEVLRSMWETLKVGLGTSGLNEDLMNLAILAQNAIAWFQDLSPETKRFIGRAFLLTAALAALLIPLSIVGLVMTGLATTFGGLATATRLLFSPFTKVLQQSARIVGVVSRMRGVSLSLRVLLKIFSRVALVFLGPIGAVVAFGMTLKTLYDHWDRLKSIAVSTKDVFVGLWVALGEQLDFKWIKDAKVKFQEFKDLSGVVFDSITGWFKEKKVLEIVWGKIPDWVKWVIAKTGGAITFTGKALKESAMAPVRMAKGISSMVGDAAGGVANFTNRMRQKGKADRLGTNKARSVQFVESFSRL